MRVTLLSRFPRVDTVPWKRALAGDLLRQGIELSVVYSRSALSDQLQAGLKEFGLGILPRYLNARRSRQPTAGEARGEPVSLAAWARERGVPVVEHRRLGSDACLATVRSLSPDVIALVGADIVPASILPIPAIGTVNPHYGLLPRYRGMSVTEWSIWHDDPLGVTVHMVDAGIDTGDILLRERIAAERGDTLASLRTKHQDAAARLLSTAIRQLGEGRAERIAQRPEDGRQYYRMHPELRRRVEEKLASGGYRWLGRPAAPLAA